MILDLTGKTVTESLARLRDGLAKCNTGELVAKTDSEAVKLNLYNAVHRMGLTCTAEKHGSLHHIIVTTSGRKVDTPGGVGRGGPSTRRQTQTAFPVRHMSRAEASPHDSDDDDTIPIQHTPPNAFEDSDDPLDETIPPTSMPKVDRRRSWLVIQSDQIGSRDPRLGFELLEDLLTHLDPTHYEGIFLVHRAVALLDPTYQGGRGLRVLLRKNLPTLVCQKSIAYYGMEKRVHKPVRAVPFRHLLDLGKHYNLVWV